MMLQPACALLTSALCILLSTRNGNRQSKVEPGIFHTFQTTLRVGVNFSEPIVTPDGPAPVTLGALPFGPVNMMSLGFDGSRYQEHTVFNMFTSDTADYDLQVRTRYGYRCTLALC
jgi:hypothetical protein